MTNHWFHKQMFGRVKIQTSDLRWRGYVLFIKCHSWLGTADGVGQWSLEGTQNCQSTSDHSYLGTGIWCLNLETRGEFCGE
ncbi:hypothetical protein C5167_010699 [Papaver somniferum]|uniref:Uncharacterized protein n=1 Tax=Papaver somniferum TaxID=3469 RepID=A0A4Y7K0Z5_PAPSO|nr:hypothetical protein C5167_010699 [Papaver somniferum]